MRDASGAVVRGAAVRWVSSDPATATVSPAGLLTAVRPGTARITVSSGDQSATGVVTVVLRTTGRIVRVRIDPSTSSVAVGRTVQLTGTALGAGGQATMAEWHLWDTDNPLVASVTSDGRVTGSLRGPRASPCHRGAHR